MHNIPPLAVGDQVTCAICLGSMVDSMVANSTIDNQDIESNKPAEWIQNYIQMENNYYILGLIVKLEQNP